MLKFIIFFSFCLLLAMQAECPTNCATCDELGKCSACNSGFILDTVLNECSEEYS